jgi:hypothetical protein
MNRLYVLVCMPGTVSYDLDVMMLCNVMLYVMQERNWNAVVALFGEEKVFLLLVGFRPHRRDSFDR